MHQEFSRSSSTASCVPSQTCTFIENLQCVSKSHVCNVCMCMPICVQATYVYNCLCPFVCVCSCSMHHSRAAVFLSTYLPSDKSIMMKDFIVTSLPFGDHIIISFPYLFSLSILSFPLCPTRPYLLLHSTSEHLVSSFPIVCLTTEVIVPKAVGM